MNSTKITKQQESPSVSLVFGPMATLSHAALRCLVAKFCPPQEYFCEMINAQSLVAGGPFEKYYLMSAPEPQKLVWQITGGKTHALVEAANILCNKGGLGIDLNMACSAPLIAKTGAGIAWMTKKTAIETATMVQKVKAVILQNATPQNPIRLSAKIRLGGENWTKMGLFSFCDMLVENGVNLITLHPRTQRQSYSRPALKGAAQDLALHLKKTKTKVYLSGDIKDKDSLQEAYTVCPDCSGFMVSRALVQRPWIFSSFMGDSIKQVNLFQIGTEYIDLVQKYQPKEFWQTRLKRFFSFFCLNLCFSHWQITNFQKCSTIKDFLDSWQNYFIKCPQEKIKML